MIFNDFNDFDIHGVKDNLVLIIGQSIVHVLSDRFDNFLLKL